jgi:hypothetical protein
MNRPTVDPLLLLAWGLLIGVAGITVVLGIAGRPWRRWLTPAGQFLLVWWCGVAIGRNGRRSGLAIFSGLSVVLLLGDRAIQGTCAMFRP